MLAGRESENGPAMQTKVSIDLNGKRKSLKSEQISMSANRSHLELQIQVEGKDSVSVQFDREMVFGLLRACFRGGMLDSATSRLLRSMVLEQTGEPDIGR